MMPTEPMVLVARMGPNTAPGSTVTSSVGPASLLMKSQAARSASVLDFTYADTGWLRSVQSCSSNGARRARCP